MARKESNGDCDDGEQYEMVPPEGGWGYMVCIGLSVIFVSINSIYKRFSNIIDYNNVLRPVKFIILNLVLDEIISTLKV